MKALQFSDAQKAFILKRDADGVPVSRKVIVKTESDSAAHVLGKIKSQSRRFNACALAPFQA